MVRSPWMYFHVSTVFTAGLPFPWANSGLFLGQSDERDPECKLKLPVWTYVAYRAGVGISNAYGSFSTTMDRILRFSPVNGQWPGVNVSTSGSFGTCSDALPVWCTSSSNWETVIWHGIQQPLWHIVQR